MQFIEEDVNAKKTLVSSLPTKTNNIKKYNDKIVSLIKKYSYIKIVSKYLDVKVSLLI